MPPVNCVPKEGYEDAEEEETNQVKHPSSSITNNDGDASKSDWLTRLMAKYGIDITTSPLYVLAPMVEQSDLPFRMQCRKYGVHLCFTPMIHSKLFCLQPHYRAKFTPRDLGNLDRPLIAQLCGHDLDHLVETATAIAPYCDAVDLNCGCPQMIAKRGRYGAFLLDEPDALVELVTGLCERLRGIIPVTVKVRLVPEPYDPTASNLDASLALYHRLVAAGCTVLTVHGRNRNHKGPSTCAADWSALQRIVKELPIPVIANGNVASIDTAQACLAATGAAGVMSAEAILERPNLFAAATNTGKDHAAQQMSQLDLAEEYLTLCQTYPPEQGGQGTGLKTQRMHLHHFLHKALQEQTDIRQMVQDATSCADLWRACAILRERGSGTQVESDLSWYYRYQMRKQKEEARLRELIEHRKENPALDEEVDEEEEAAVCFDNLFNM